MKQHTLFGELSGRDLLSERCRRMAEVERDVADALSDYGLSLVSSVVTVGLRQDPKLTLHVRVLRRGRELLAYWPGTGRWRTPDGDQVGSLTDPGRIYNVTACVPAARAGGTSPATSSRSASAATGCFTGAGWRSWRCCPAPGGPAWCSGSAPTASSD